MLPMKMPSPSSSSLSSMRIKHLIPTLLRSCALQISRSLSKTRSFVAQTIKEKLNQVHIEIVFPMNWDKKSKKKMPPFGTSFRFHYNWCSSSHLCYYDATWDSMIPMEQQLEGKRDSPSLSGYLEWLEEKDHHVHSSGESKAEEYLNEIDKLADKFIAKCHEKFILEKQESYRRSLHEDVFSVYQCAL